LIKVPVISFEARQQFFDERSGKPITS